MKISSEVAIENSNSNSNLTRSPAIQNYSSPKVIKSQSSMVDSKVAISEMTDENGNPTEQAYQTAVNKLNEFMELSQKNSKFIFHKNLERYYVEIVDAQTQEVVKEIPPKELLDAYYEMQKLVGKMFDTQA